LLRFKNKVWFFNPTAPPGRLHGRIGKRKAND
jgi:hypothetical protein